MRPDGVLRSSRQPPSGQCTVCETVRDASYRPALLLQEHVKTYTSPWSGTVHSKPYGRLNIWSFVAIPFRRRHACEVPRQEAQLNREPAAQPLGVTVVNHYPASLRSMLTLNDTALNRFLGGVDVNYSRYSFQDFAANPETVLHRSAYTGEDDESCTANATALFRLEPLTRETLACGCSRSRSHQSGQ